MRAGFTWVPKSYVTVRSSSILVISTVDSMEDVETHLKTQGPQRVHLRTNFSLDALKFRT